MPVIGTSSIGHNPTGKWEFDEEVTECFNDMLSRSIPQYEVMRESVLDIGKQFIKPMTSIIDLGCSRGESIDALVRTFPNNRFYGIEVSKPMVRAAREKFKHDPNVTIIEKDLKEFYPEVTHVSLVLSILALQFIPINYRHQIVQSVYNSLQPGGAFILVEKVLGNTDRINQLMVSKYHELKRSNGYSYEEIDRKAMSLEGVLVPITSDWNVDMLRKTGFREVDCFWRYLNFGGWVAIK